MASEAAVADEELESLQRKLLNGDLAPVPVSIASPLPVAHRVLQEGYGSTAPVPANQVYVTAIDRSMSALDCTDPAAYVEQRRRDAAQPNPVRHSQKNAAAHIRLSDFIYSEKKMYEKEVGSYQEFMQRLKRGRATMERSAESNHRTESLADYSEKVKCSLNEKLAYADFIVDHAKEASSAAMRQMFQSVGMTTTTVLSSTESPSVASQDIPATLQRMIDAAKTRNRGGAAGFTLSLKHGVMAKKPSVTVQHATDATVTASSADQEESTAASLRDNDNTIAPGDAPVDNDGDLGSVFLTAAEITTENSDLSGEGDPHKDASLPAHIENIVNVIGSSRKPPSTFLVDPAASSSELESRIQMAAMDAGLVVSSERPTFAEEMGGHSAEMHRSFSFSIASPRRAPQPGLETDPTTSVSFGPSSSPTNAPARLQRTKSIVWASSTCSCESTFHSIKQKMFDDIRRAMQVRYVSGFVGQISSLAAEVVQWREAMSSEVHRALDFVAVLLAEKEDMERKQATLLVELEMARLAANRRDHPKNDSACDSTSCSNVNSPRQSLYLPQRPIPHNIAAVNASLERSLMAMHDNSNIVLNSRSASRRGHNPTASRVGALSFPTSPRASSSRQSRRGSVTRDDDESTVTELESVADLSGRPHRIAEGKLRLVSTRQVDAATQTTTLEDFLFENTERIMHAGNIKPLDLAAFATAAVINPMATGLASPILAPRETTLTSPDARGAQSTSGGLSAAACDSKATARLMAVANGLQAPELDAKLKTALGLIDLESDQRLQSDLLAELSPEAAAAAGEDASGILMLILQQQRESQAASGNLQALSDLGTVFRQVSSMSDAIQHFSKDIITQRPRRIDDSTIRVIQSVEHNQVLGELEDMLRSNLHVMARSIHRHQETVVSSISRICETITSRQTASDECAAWETKAKTATAQNQELQAALQQLTDTNASLEEKNKKLAVQLNSAKSKQDKTKEAVLIANKDQQIQKLRRTGELLRSSIARVVAGTRSALQEWCGNGKNDVLAMAINNILDNALCEPRKSAEDVAADDAASLQQCDGLVAALERLSDDRMVLSSETAPDPTLVGITKNLIKSSELIMATLRLNRLDVPLEIMDGIAQRSSEIAASCISSVVVDAANEMTHFTDDMMQILRKELPLQRKVLITPFVTVVRKLLHDARDDVRITSSTLEWYLHKKAKEKDLLKGEENAQNFAEQTEAEENDAGEGNLEASQLSPSMWLTTSTSMATSPIRSASPSSPLKRTPSKRNLPRALDENDDANPVGALQRKLQTYRRAYERISDLISEKQAAIASEVNLGEQLQQFANVDHGPFASHLRRNVKDVMSRMIAIIEGKSASTAAIMRDTGEGTDVVELNEGEAQTTGVVEFSNQASQFLIDDIENFEGDPDAIHKMFQEYRTKIMTVGPLAAYDRVMQGESDEDFVGRENYAAEVQHMDAVEMSNSNEDTPDSVALGRPDDVWEGNGTPRSHLPVAPHEGGGIHVHVYDLHRLTPLSAPLHEKVNLRQQRMSLKSSYTQTAMDCEYVASLCSRLPLTQVFLMAPIIGQALETLENVDPLSREIRDLSTDFANISKLYNYREGKTYNELGHQLLRIMEKVLVLTHSELLDRTRIRISFASSGAADESTAKRRRKTVANLSESTVAIQSTPDVKHQAVSADASDRLMAGGQPMSLEEQELMNWSMAPLFQSLSQHVEIAKAARERMLASAAPTSPLTGKRKVSTPAASPSAAPIPAPPDVLVVGSPSTPIQGTDVHPQRILGLRRESNTPTVGNSRPPLAPVGTSPAPPVVALPAMSTLTNVDQNIVTPIRRAVFRFLNEPPFSMPLVRGEEAPRQRLCEGSFRNEIESLGIIHQCLAQYAELCSSYRRTIIRLVGQRWLLRRWERSRNDVLVESLLVIEYHSKHYAFLTAKPPIMNSRARREEQARRLSDRSERIHKLIQQKADSYRAEVLRLERVVTRLRHQREEHVLLFLKDYYFPNSSTALAAPQAVAAPTTVQTAHPRSTLITKSLARVLPDDARATSIITTLIHLMWALAIVAHPSDMNTGMAGEDPKSRSFWFDRSIGTSQGGTRVRFDGTHQSVIALLLDEDGRPLSDDDPHRHGSPKTVRNVVPRLDHLSAADVSSLLHELREHEYFGLSNTTVGLRSAASSHSLYTRRKAGLSLVPTNQSGVGHSAPNLRLSTIRYGSPPPPPVAAIASDVSDETAAGHKMPSWKGGLLHLDLQSEDTERLAAIARTPSPLLTASVTLHKQTTRSDDTRPVSPTTRAARNAVASLHTSIRQNNAPTSNVVWITTPAPRNPPATISAPPAPVTVSAASPQPDVHAPIQTAVRTPPREQAPVSLESARPTPTKLFSPPRTFQNRKGAVQSSNPRIASPPPVPAVGNSILTSSSSSLGALMASRGEPSPFLRKPGAGVQLAPLHFTLSPRDDASNAESTV